MLLSKVIRRSIRKQTYSHVREEQANETVEKLFFQSTIPGQQLVEGLHSRSEGGLQGGWVGKGSVECPKGVDLADVVDQGEQAPLYIHFPFGP